MVDDFITRSEFFSSLGQFEERLNQRMDVQFGRFANQLDEKLQAMDARFQSLDGKFNALDGKFNVLDGKFNALDGKFDALDEKVHAGLGSVHARLGSLEHGMNIQFEETRGLIRLSLEGLDALRETTDAGSPMSDTRTRITRPYSTPR
jgi:hypothetical protein